MKIEFNFHYRMCNFFHLLFEIWEGFFVVVMFLRKTEKHHYNEFSLLSQKAFPNFELLVAGQPTMTIPRVDDKIKQE